MPKCLRIMGLCVSLSVFLGLLGLLAPIADAGAAHIVECPCNYDAVPPSTECFVAPFPSSPLVPLRMLSDITRPPLNNQLCDLLISDPGTIIQLFVGRLSTGELFCDIDTFGDLPAPCILDVPATVLSQEEFDACQCELQAYATALNAVNPMPEVPVDGGPPYECSTPPIECAQPTPIPTLNQWGMIIMAGVLGLFAVIGLFVMKRKNVVMPSN